MKKLLFVLPFLVSCGNDSTHITASTPFGQECDKASMSLTTNCSAPGPAPTPTPPPPASTLTLTGPSPAPSGAGYVSTGSARLPGSPLTGWQSFGLSNATIPVVKVFGTSMVTSGQCQQVDVKMVVGSPAPVGLQGTFYNQGQPYRYQYCLDNGDVVIGFEDGGDSNFTDFKIRVHSNLGSLNYKMVGANVFVCLD